MQANDSARAASILSSLRTVPNIMAGFYALIFSPLFPRFLVRRIAGGTPRQTGKGGRARLLAFGGRFDRRV